MLAPVAKLILIVAAVSLACSSKKGGDESKPDKTQATGDAASKPPPAPPADARATAADGDGDGDAAGDPFAAIGVEPCDDYIERQRSCVESHAPRGIKDQQLDGLAHIATRWRRAAAAGASDHLQTSCKSLLDASADATAAWKCKW